MAGQQTIRTKIEELEARLQNHPDDLDSHIQLRYLYLAEGDHERARAVPTGLDAARADVLQRTVEAVVAAESAIRQPGVVDSDIQRSVDELAEWIQARADLQIPRVALCTQIHSYGRYEPVPEGSIATRRLNRVLLYCELKNFASEQMTDGRYRTHLAHRLQLLTPDGATVWQDQREKEVTDYCENRRTDFFFNRLWELPANVAGGKYVLKVIVEDKIKSQVAEATHPVTIGSVAATGPQY